jgi:serine/threonine-protein kinase ATR
LVPGTIEKEAVFSRPEFEKRRLQILCNWNRYEVSQTDESQKYFEVFSPNLLSQHITDMEQLRIFVVSSFDTLEQSAKANLIRQIGRLPCVLTESYSFVSGRCGNCDRVRPVLDMDRQSLDGLKDVFTSIIQSENFDGNEILRIETLVSIRRAFTCYRPGIPFGAATELGAWIIRCLKSTSREIRIATAGLLPLFVAISGQEAANNMDQIFKVLSNMNFKQDPYFFETTVIAWGQLGRVSIGERLNLILIRLIDYLGSPNSFHCSVAFQEIRSIAKAKMLTCYQLCTPFWPTISVLVVKQMEEKKSLLARFSELLEITVSDFLYRTLPFTVPYLVLSRRYDLVSTIASACGSTAKRVYLEHVPVILAVLLTQNVDHPGDFAEERWLEADVSFSRVSFPDVVGSNMVGLTFEILKLYDGDDDPKTARIRHALEYIASLKSGRDPAPSELPELFRESDVVELVAMFSDTVRNISGRKPDTTKLQCLKGISMMIQCCGDRFVCAVPQICTFLQSALDMEELQEAAIQAWHIMIVHLTENFQTILDLTFAVVVQKWSTFTSEAKSAARAMLEYIIVNNGGVLAARTNKSGVPLLTDVPELKELDDKLKLLEPVRSPFWRLRNLINRSCHENIYIVRQTVIELRSFVLDEQAAIQQGMSNEKNLELIQSMIRSLFNLAFTFNSADSDIPDLCAVCLGLIGAIDQHKIDISPKKDNLIVMNNFDNAEESITFVTELLEKHLVKLFKASTDPNTQGFLAFGLQEYLKFCHLSKKSEDTQGRWKRFSSDSKAILLPHASTRYQAQPAPPASRLTGPIFNQSISYSLWLQKFTYDLMSKAKPGNARQIFNVCRQIVRDKEQYQAIYDFVLPYVALNVTIGGNEDDSQAVLQEIQTILNTPSEQADDMGPFHSKVFAIVDYFSQWMRARRKYESDLGHPRGRAVLSDSPVSKVNKFLDTLSSNLMAQRSYDCKSFPRAIMYWEQHLRKVAQPLSSESTAIYAKFQEIYASIEDPDALDGISTKLPSLSIEKQILQYEHTGKWSDALECYEVLLKSNSNWNLPLQLKMMNCLKKNGRYDDLLARLDATIVKLDTIPDEWVNLGVEVSWLSGRWNSLEHWLSEASRESYESNVGKALLALKDRRKEELLYCIGRARASISSALSSTYITSLGQCGESIVRLHGLADLESIGDLAFNRFPKDHKTVSSYLDNRLSMVGANFESRRYLLALRRSAISVSGLPFAVQEVGITWIASARDARKQGQPGLALQALLQGLVAEHPSASVEYAKLLWDQGEQRKAVTTLEGILNPGFRDSGSNSGDKMNLSRQEAKDALLYTRWLDMSDQADSETIIARYKAVARVDAMREKAYYRLAKYYTKLYDYQLQLDEPLRNSSFLEGELERLMVINYCRSLVYGVKYVYETLPKMITTWLDFAAQIKRPPASQKYVFVYFLGEKKHLTFRSSQAKVIKARTDVLRSINEFLMKSTIRVPSYFVSFNPSFSIFFLSLTLVLPCSSAASIANHPS